MQKKIYISGACGYKGSVLVPKLLNLGYHVRAVDTMWFGNNLVTHPNLEIRKFDILKDLDYDLGDIDTVIHLASIANDPTGDLDPKLTWETNSLATMQLAAASVKSGVRNFIFASSGSVYGIKEELQVTEDLGLVPISEYNKTKMIAERVLLSYLNDMNIQILRPATVCGVSPRMRLDVSVNLLTMSALSKQKITVFGGDQIRPNVHIEDICNAYVFMIENQQFSGIFNVGFENLSIAEIAKMVQEKLDVPIEIQGSSDPRSYRINSDKLLNAGFLPKYGVNHAIDEIIAAYQLGKLKDEETCYNLNWMIKSVLNETGS